MTSTTPEVAAAVAASSADPYSPWHARDRWWVNAEVERVLPFACDGSPIPVAIVGDQLTVDGRTVSASATRAADGRLDMVLDEVRERVSVARAGDNITVRRSGETYWLQLPDPMAAAAEEDDAGGGLVAPIPGQVTQVVVEPGMSVSRGQVMVVLEAMKTVFRLGAPADGTIATVSCRVGDNVVEGQLLVAFAEEGSLSPP